MLKPEILEDARKLKQAGAGSDLILLFLRSRGFDKIDSINAVRDLFQKSFPEAKTLIDESKVWSDRYESDMEFRKLALEALRKLATTTSLDIQIIIKDDLD